MYLSCATSRRRRASREERDEFISVVSHELRTPIAIAEGSLSNAKLLVERKMTSKIPEAIDESHKQILFLARMINDLSTLSRAERGVADETEIIDVAELAAQINSEYSPQAGEKGLAFNLDIGGRLGVVKSFSSISGGNLQKLHHQRYSIHTKKALSLYLSRKLNLAKSSSRLLTRELALVKADMAKIFDKFYRAEDYRTRETKGTGLGLYVSAKLAKKLGCKIEVESRLNHGSTFGFKLKEFKIMTNNIRSTCFFDSDELQ